MTFNQIKKELQKLKNLEKAKIYAKFFIHNYLNRTREIHFYTLIIL